MNAHIHRTLPLGSTSAVRPPRRTARAAIGLSLLAGLALAGCSGTPGASTGVTVGPSAAASSAPSTAPSVETSAAASASAAAGGAVNELAITGKEFAFEGPTSVPAGVTRITLTNAGQEEHQAQLAKIADGKTMQDVLTTLQSDESAALALLTLSGGPNQVVPGASGAATSKLDPGNYIFLCFISGADGIPHLAKGMVAALEVTGSATADAVPAGDSTVKTQDFAFVGLDKLTPGKHTITVDNAGPQPHEMGIVKLSEGVAVADLIPMFTATTPPPDGPPPFTSAGGLTAIAAGSSANVEVDLPAGNYAFICFVPDPATGKPHAALGMIGSLTVAP
jgi:uncharacterized cupredoxin-like copper-binding protein